MEDESGRSINQEAAFFRDLANLELSVFDMRQTHTINHCSPEASFEKHMAIARTLAHLFLQNKTTAPRLLAHLPENDVSDTRVGVAYATIRHYYELNRSPREIGFSRKFHKFHVKVLVHTWE